MRPAYIDCAITNCRSSLNLESVAWTYNIKRKDQAPLRLATTVVERQAFFVRDQMSKGQSQSRCDKKTKLRASPSQSVISQSLNSDNTRGIPSDKASTSTVVLDRRVHNFFVDAE